MGTSGRAQPSLCTSLFSATTLLQSRLGWDGWEQGYSTFRHATCDADPPERYRVQRGLRELRRRSGAPPRFRRKAKPELTEASRLHNRRRRNSGRDPVGGARRVAPRGAGAKGPAAPIAAVRRPRPLNPALSLAPDRSWIASSVALRQNPPQESSTGQAANGFAQPAASLPS